MMRRPRWNLLPNRNEEARQLARAAGLHPVVAHILLNRGIAPERLGEFLQPTRASLHDPALLPDLETAAERLAAAIRERRKIVVYGDYDADGSSAGALVARFLRDHQCPFSYYVPDRIDEGYGLNAKAVVSILTQERPGLLLTVDCGISSAEEIDTAVALGTEVIVTDHHQVPERLPAVPAVNPHRADSRYPFPELCGTAVAYKLCCAAAELLGQSADEVEAALLELVAIGTVADVMPLVDENRYFTVHGLAALARTQSPGLQALLDVAGLAGNGALSARDIAFGVGPRLNAAGRLGSGRDAYQLLVTEDRAEAYQLAEHLERLNRERQELEQRCSTEAERQVSELSLHEVWGLVVHGNDWHEGVVGLVAGRLCQRHSRPALAISVSGETARGSARSIAAVDVFAALSDCGEVLTELGGHPRACGFGLAAADLPALAERFNAAVKTRMTADDLVTGLDLECRIKAGAVTLELAKALEGLAPFGEGHREPLLEIQGFRLGQVRATRDGKHLQLDLLADAARETRVKGFWPRQGHLAERLEPGRPARVAGYVRVDAWQGREQPQVVVEDLRFDHGDGSD